MSLAPPTRPLPVPSASTSFPAPVDGGDWGANFWITIIDPQTNVEFYACPGTGQASWEPPEGIFVMPPNDEGQWWELQDEARDNISYYYHTKTGVTQWTRPEGFVIPLGIIQTTTALGRRLSQNTKRTSSLHRNPSSSIAGSLSSTHPRIVEEPEPLEPLPPPRDHRPPRRSTSNDSHPPQSYRGATSALTTIPASSPEPSTPSKGPPKKPSALRSASSSSSMSPSSPYKGQSLQAAAEYLRSASGSDHPLTKLQSASDTHLVLPPNDRTTVSAPSTPMKFSHQQRKDSGASSDREGIPRSPRRPIPDVPQQPRQRKDTLVAGKEIGYPTLDMEATEKMSPVKARKAGKPIFVERPSIPTKRLSSGDHRTLPRDLASDIQQFVVSDFARLYFSTHRTGLIFKRRVPVEKMMTWQKNPLTSPLLVLNRSLAKDAVKIFKVIQRIMGDRERDRPVGVRMPTDALSTVPSISSHVSGNGASSITSNGSANGVVGTLGVLEEERWLLAEGVRHGELRDEIYCQTVKQLSENPNPESVFRGWQFLCVLLVTFPPSKNFEAYLRSFMQDSLKDTEGRVDVMAKYCLHRLTAIAKKGPRGKPPTCQEIESASDAAFNPSTFGESLDSIFRLQQRTYADAKVPIILPFLADGILALGGTKAEGTFRVPGDGDSVGELKVRIDRGYYNLEGIDDCHVPASLFKLWLRELQDPLIPSEMYNDCVACANDPDRVVETVKKLPTINRRVLLFVISFLQLFLAENIQSVTKMTAPNLALVMAPNLLRCTSESMAVVFTNAQYEQLFVHNLLLHLKCGKVDPEYTPVHGLGAGSPSSSVNGRHGKSRPRPPLDRRDSAHSTQSERRKYAKH